MVDPWVLGISMSHNGAACLLRGQRIVCAIQEERLTRFKRDRVYIASPSRSAEYCLEAAGITWADLDLVVVCGQRIHERNSHLQNPRIRAYDVPVKYISHHLGHAIGVYSQSGFPEATVVVVDGNGSRMSEMSKAEQKVCRVKPEHKDPSEWASTYHFKGKTWAAIDKHVSMGWAVPRPHQMALYASLGGLYSASSEVIFGDFMSGAGKVMGLAAYGRIRFPHNNFFSIVEGGGNFQWKSVVSDYFALSHEWPNDAKLFADLAASTQAALEVGLDHIFSTALEKAESTLLCYSGGVSLNTVYNDKLYRSQEWGDVFILPAADDAGTAIGAAYYGLWELGGEHQPRRIEDDGLGRTYNQTEILADLRSNDIDYAASQTDIGDALDEIDRGESVGWFMGRSEYGPRALGHRSILSDPRNPDSIFQVNKMKQREQFRPLAASVLEDHAGKWFDLEQPSPFMLRSVPVNPDKAAQIPGVLHVDGSCRPQTVGTNCGDYHKLLTLWHQRTGVPMLLNTSFNSKEEPIVETPSDAVRAAVKLGLRYVYFSVGEQRALRVLTRRR